MLMRRTCKRSNWGIPIPNEAVRWGENGREGREGGAIVREKQGKLRLPVRWMGGRGGGHCWFLGFADNSVICLHSMPQKVRERGRRGGERGEWEVV